MKFPVDAQLPYRLARFIQGKGHDVVHTDDMPNQERTSDTEIRALAKSDGRIVISKDKDFHDSHILQKEPAKLLLISTGNIVNRACWRFSKPTGMKLKTNFKFAIYWN